MEKEPGALSRSLSLGRPLTVASSVPFTPSSFKFFQNGLYLWAAKNVPYFFFLCPMSVHDPFFSFFFFKWFVKFCAGDFFFFKFYLFIFGCVGSSFLCEGLLQLRRAGATLHRGSRGSHYRGLSCCGAQAPDAQA